MKDDLPVLTLTPFSPIPSELAGNVAVRGLVESLVSLVKENKLRVSRIKQNEQDLGDDYRAADAVETGITQIREAIAVLAGYQIDLEQVT